MSLTSKIQEKEKQIEQLEAENKRLIRQLNQAIESDAKLNESLQVLKAENEKLKNDIIIIVKSKRIGNNLHVYQKQLTEQARIEERAKIAT